MTTIKKMARTSGLQATSQGAKETGGGPKQPGSGPQESVSFGSYTGERLPKIGAFATLVIRSCVADSGLSPYWLARNLIVNSGVHLCPQ